ncbi:MAG: hypothetical protein IT368_13970, partial [Candidatus Hydrogenedentes bacterium]|nr:hypothetical protein [Candidatus Hydrogenedentota bacterium]
MVRYETEYPVSLRVGLACSLIVHVAGLLSAGMLYARKELELSSAVHRDPIVLNLQPPPSQQSPPPVRQLIEDVRPSDARPEETDRISDVNSKAADEALSTGENPGPRPLEVSDFDSMAAPPVPPTPPREPAPPAPPQPEARPANSPKPPAGRSSDQPRKP